ncbi:MAG: hypothetical protein QM638_15410 [Nocardioides sp.]|uniref:hypothetical protein n=1 Tax=Nocardioides sp. TaxID=35761 RepID=UPI0039E6FA06
MIEYGARTRPMPAPADIVFDDLASPRATGTRAWLLLLDDERPPTVIESDRPRHLVWSSLWTKRPEDRVVLDLTTGSRGDSRLGFTLLAAGDPPDEALTGHIRKRINQLLFAGLRSTYGQ